MNCAYLYYIICDVLSDFAILPPYYLYNFHIGVYFEEVPRNYQYLMKHLFSSMDCSCPKCLPPVVCTCEYQVHSY